MIKTFVVLVAVLGLSAGQLRDKDDITYYSCAGKPDGNYRSPINYMQFITCHNGRASERDCAICHVNALNCPDGRLCYVPEVDACQWVNDPQCIRGDAPSTTEESLPPTTPTTRAPTSTPTTQAPTTTPKATTTTTEGTEAPVTTDEPTSSAPPVTNSTEAPVTPAPGFCEGTPTTCSLDEDCSGNGCCRSKWFCVRIDSPLGPAYDTHVVVTDVCGTDPATGEQLYFNPDSTNLFGGKCDLFRYLPAAIKELYRSDKDCIDQCECHPDSPCSSTYNCYKNGVNSTLSCGPGEGFDRFEGCTSTCK